MYTLVARDTSGSVIGQIPLGPAPVTVGRDPTCDVILPSSSVSRRHASAYEREDGAVVITDEGSANGVKVDGHLISGPTLVDHGNRVQVSGFVLELVPEGKEISVPSQPPPAPPGMPEPSALMPPPVGAPTMPGQMVPPSGLPPAEDGDNENLNMTMLEPHAGAAVAMALAPLQLMGKGGPYDGTVFPLDKPLITVGRTGENDLRLDDPSISRRHAQVRLGAAGQSFTLLDLRSSNGTFVDGKRIKRTDCAEGSAVRFGDLVFKVELRQADEAVAPKQVMTRKRLMTLVGAVLALLIGVGVVAYIKRPKPPPPKVVTPEERLRLRKAEIQKLVDEGKKRLTLRQWAEATTVLDKALNKDPLNQEAQSLREKAALESENEATYNKGMQYYGLGNQENMIKAKEVFLKVDKTSIYAREVRYKVRTINERLSESYRIEGVSRCKARYWPQCHKALCTFFELAPTDRSVPGEGRLRAQLQKVEKRIKRRRGFVPCTAARFLNPVKDTHGAADPDKVLSAKYPNKMVRQVMMVYLEGRVDTALKLLGKLRKDRSMRPHEATLREIDRQLLIIRGKYQEGFSDFRERKADDARKKWALVLSADAALLPTSAEKGATVQSFFRREIARALGDLYFELGDEQYKLGRYRQAHTQWAAGKLSSPNHDKVLNGLLQLEKVAEKLVREGKSLAGQGDPSSAREKLQTALDITEPGRPVRTDAEQALKGM